MNQAERMKVRKLFRSGKNKTQLCQIAEGYLKTKNILFPTKIQINFKPASKETKSIKEILGETYNQETR
jgi:uncharacterized protein YcsI (UPF0317 family)